MNMIQKRYLIGGSGELAIIIITLLEITHLMAKFGVYEVKTIYTMIIIVFVLTVVFVYLNVPPLLMSLLCFIRSKVILTNTTPTDTTHIETTTTDIPHIETTPMDIITETTQIETIPMDTTPIYTHTNTTPMNAILINTTPTDTIDNINNTYINSKNKEKNKLVNNGKRTDRQMVAQIFMNRLYRKMSLGSDVTTYYGLGIELSQRDLTKAELNMSNPYNTRGAGMQGKLPIGPIGFISEESIDIATEISNNYIATGVKSGKTKRYYITNIGLDFLNDSFNIKKLKEKGEL